MSTHTPCTGKFGRCLVIVAAVMFVSGVGVASAAATGAAPTGYLGCGITGKITVSPRLQGAAAGGVRQVKVTATLTDCNGPFSTTKSDAVLTGPAIHSGLLTVAGTGTLDPTGPASDCSAARLVWRPSTAWQIIWKAGPNGTGMELGRSLIRGMTLGTNYTVPNSLWMGIFNFYGETDAVTNEPASWTGAFGDQTALFIGGFGNVPVVADANLCGTAAGLQTLTFSGPTGDPRADPPDRSAVRIDL